MSNMDAVNKIYAAFAAGSIPAALELLTRRSSGSQPKILRWRIAARTEA